MLISLIAEKAEKELIAFIEEVNEQNAAWGALYLRFSQVPLFPAEEEMIELVNPVMKGIKTSIFFCEDGDLFVVWRGMRRNLLQQLTDSIYEGLKNDLAEFAREDLFAYFDLLAHGEELRLICKKKIAAVAPASAPLGSFSTTAAHEAEPSKPQEMAGGVKPLPRRENAASSIRTRQTAIPEEYLERRRLRKQLEILVVEDQFFSVRLMMSILGNEYKIYAEGTAETALERYFTHVPDMVFLDIELPGMNGHELAERINELDPHAFIVMVTASKDAHDAARAKDNRTKGFVVKPYSRQKILDCMERFMNERKPKTEEK
ncbi:MAG: response regulator [Dongiaceae bacterium]